jgi:hypothetical protein
MRFIHGIVAIIQFILHYLALAGIIFGVIAFIFGNSTRGGELLIGGASLMALKYVIGFIYLGLVKMTSKTSETEQGK